MSEESGKEKLFNGLVKMWSVSDNQFEEVENYINAVDDDSQKFLLSSLSNDNIVGLFKKLMAYLESEGKNEYCEDEGICLLSIWVLLPPWLQIDKNLILLKDKFEDKRDLRRAFWMLPKEQRTKKLFRELGLKKSVKIQMEYAVANRQNQVMENKSGGNLKELENEMTY